jgi:hypothetical protein
MRNCVPRLPNDFLGLVVLLCRHLPARTLTAPSTGTSTARAGPETPATWRTSCCGTPCTPATATSPTPPGPTSICRTNWSTPTGRRAERRGPGSLLHHREPQPGSRRGDANAVPGRDMCHLTVMPTSLLTEALIGTVTASVAVPAPLDKGKVPVCVHGGSS